MGAIEFNLTHSDEDDDDESDDSGMGDKPVGRNVVNIIGSKSGEVKWVSEDGIEATRRRTASGAGLEVDATADFMDDFNDNVASEKT